jgi:hypothetical protein
LTWGAGRGRELDGEAIELLRDVVSGSACGFDAIIFGVSELKDGI